MRRFSKDELVTVSKMKGWRGQRAKHRLEFFYDLLTKQHGLTDQQIREMYQQAMKGGVDKEVQVVKEVEVFKGVKLEPDVQAAIRIAVQQAHPHKIVLDEATGKTVVLKERTHAIFEKVLRLAKTGRINVLLRGPAGCGKSHLAAQLAKAMQREFGTLHCTAGASESQLLGWLLPIGKGGSFEYVAAEFARMYMEGGCVFLLDEVDAADPNMLLVINGALANESIHIPQRHKQPHVARGKNVCIVAAANTYGTGADMLYAGRNQLDAATLDRFYVVDMDYDKDLERDLSGGDEEVLQYVWGLRAKIAEHRLRRVASTRMIQKAVAAKKAGVSWADVKKELLAGWSRDELLKAMVLS